MCISRQACEAAYEVDSRIASRGGYLYFRSRLTGLILNTLEKL